MNSEFDLPQDVGYGLGTIAVENAAEKFEEVREQEKRRRTLRNEPEIASLRARGVSLKDERTSVRRALDRVQSEIGIPRAKRIFSGIVATLLATAGFAFAYMALAPFALGRMTVVYAAGIGVVLGYWTERLLDAFHWRPVMLAVILTGFVTGFAGLLVLAHIRGEILILELRRVLASMDEDSLQDALAAARRLREPDRSCRYSLACSRFRWTLRQG